ncbi:MAG: thermonuclease family protein [Phycisphaerales bacterium]|nr:thermonuclease family protein [Phycisphaerales bacterium]
MLELRFARAPAALLCAAILGGLWSTSLANDGDESATRPVLVREVVDGDTLVVRVGSVDRRIALLGVRLTQAGAADAECFLRHLLVGERVTLQWDDRAAGADALGRYRALVRRDPDGLYVNQEMIRQGYAEADDAAPFTDLAEFKRNETAAKSAERGIWGGACRVDGFVSSGAAIDPTPTPDTTPTPIASNGKSQTPQPASDADMVCVTKSGKKYHRPDCPSVRNSATKRTLPLGEARKRYSPCSRCNPPK